MRIGSTRGSVQMSLPAMTNWPVMTSKALVVLPTQLICSPGTSPLQEKLSTEDGTPPSATTGDWSKYWIWWGSVSIA